MQRQSDVKQKTIDEDLADSRRALRRLIEAGYENGNGAYSLRKHIRSLERLKAKQNGKAKIGATLPTLQ